MATPDAAAVVRSLRARSDPSIAARSQRFFRTGPGEYGAGDRFLGIRVPAVRAEAKQWGHLALPQVAELLDSPCHEARLCAALILVARFAKADAAGRARVFALYLKKRDRINNWDLVDTSAPQIIGGFLLEREERGVLDDLAGSSSLWDRRIAIMATFAFIRCGQFADTLRLAERLLGDREDLIHKAVGWMLREIGNRDRATERAYLQARGAQMPRTMLRYAIETFPETERQHFLRMPRKAVL